MDILKEISLSAIGLIALSSMTTVQSAPIYATEYTTDAIPYTPGNDSEIGDLRRDLIVNISIYIVLFVVLCLALAIALRYIYKKIIEHQIDIYNRLSDDFQKLQDKFTVLEENTKTLSERGIQSHDAYAPLSLTSGPHKGVTLRSKKSTGSEVGSMSSKAPSPQVSEAGSSEDYPRISVLWKGLNVDAYCGRLEDNSEFMRVASSYIASQRPQTVVEEPIQVEHIDILTRQKAIVRNLPLSSRLGSVKGSQRPMSIIAEDKPYPGMAVNQDIGISGGEVRINGVKLIIPSGALDKTHNIQLGIVWEKQHFPKLQRRDALLSPIVSCQPHGLKFKVPAILEIPHCARNISKDWLYKVMVTETETGHSVNWKMTSDAESEVRAVQESHVSLRISHFTQYALVGESAAGRVAAKKVSLVAFAPPLKSGDFFDIVVYCVNDYDPELPETRKSEMEEVVKENLSDGRKKASTVQKMMFHDTEKDMRVQLSQLTEGWEAVMGSQEDLDFEDVWHAFSPNCTFKLKPKSPSIVEISCMVLGFQIGFENKVKKIKIAQREQLPAGALDKIHSSKILFPPDYRKRIATKLDAPAIPLYNNWMMLAEKMKLSFYDIKILEDLKGHKVGPGERLLQMWESEERNLEDFRNIMDDMDREDIVEDVEELIMKAKKDKKRESNA